MNRFHIPTIALPVAGAAVGLLMAAILGVGGVVGWLVGGGERLLLLGPRCAIPGAVAGALIGLLRIVDRLRSDPPDESGPRSGK